MNSYFSRFLSYKIKIKSFEVRIIDILFVAIITVLGIIARKKLFSVVSGDYTYFLKPWMTEIEKYGGFAALKHEIPSYNYTTPYFVIMCILSYLPFSWLTSLKIVSVIFDFALAISVGLIVYQMSKSTKKSVFSFAATLCLPTVILNSAAWAQCDAIYTTFMLLSIYFLLKNKNITAFIMFGISFSLKLQSVFFMPVLVILWLKGKTKLWNFLLIPGVYLVTIIPALIAGRDFMSLIKVYSGQMNQYSSLSANYPSLYTITGEWNPDLISPAATITTLVLFGILAYYLFDKKFEINSHLILKLSMLCIGMSLLFLPHMHERYGYSLDILAVIYCVTDIKRLWVSISLVMVSFLAYCPFLFGRTVFPMQYMTILLIVCVAYIAIDLYKQINYVNSEKQPKIA